MGRSSTLHKRVLPMLLLLGHLAAEISADDRPVPNGDFELTSSGGFSNDGVVDGPAGIPSWKANGTVELVESGQKQGGMILIVPQGRHAARLGNDVEISQRVKVEKGSIYSVTFSAARTCAQLESLNVSVPPASQTIDLQTLYNVQGWDPYAWAFEAEEDDAMLVFRNPSMEDRPHHHDFPSDYESYWTEAGMSAMVSALTQDWNHRRSCYHETKPYVHLRFITPSQTRTQPLSTGSRSSSSQRLIQRLRKKK